ncbi:alkene reductase [Echinicola marina]|uniref:alkene reductase n=1 Tax=Echinicola marina TaxID=2859768 RepID=UPI001CF6D9BC|nr:alkene reductase [Echinicola marina]UCS92175.1 alkene reductase [Echinicola marina]
MIFNNFKLGKLELSNRIVMAPMTRTRSSNGIMTDMNAEYYQQRASVGLIITEGTSVSASSMGYLYVPGLYNAAQTQSWKKVTNAVHEEGGKIFTQLWHVGRVAHISNQPNHFDPVAPSAIQAKNSTAWGIEDGEEGRVQVSVPRALETAEISEIVKDYVAAAKNAMEAGFDGIEIHAANGYLIDQFLNPCTNLRKDAYGGSIEKRARFALEVVDAIATVIGSDRVGIRFSPFGTQHDMAIFDEIEDTYQYLASELSKRGIAYIHLHDQGDLYREHYDFIKKFRKWYSGNIIFAGFLTKERAFAMIEKNLIDLAAFGRPLIANPDLVERFKHNYPLAEGKRDLYYGNSPEGYIDYPKYENSHEVL